jgi:hypothetical protein
VDRHRRGRQPLSLRGPARSRSIVADFIDLPNGENVASLIPVLRHTSPIAVSSSACFNTNAICASLYFDLFIIRSIPLTHDPKLEFSSSKRSRKRAAGQI